MSEAAANLSQFLSSNGRLGKLTPNYSLIKVAQFYSISPMEAAELPAVLFFETLNIITGEARAARNKKKLEKTMFA